MSRSKCLAAGLAFVIGALSQGVAFAAPDALAGYPSRTIRLLTANAPGGSADLLLRNVAEAMSRELGRPAVVENKPGADGLLAGEACARAAPDGHTLCMLDLFNWALLPKMRSNMPYRPSDLKPVMLLAYIPSGFWVNPSVSARTLNEYIQYAKQHPNALTFASWGNSSTPYLYGEFLRHTLGAELTIVPYKSPTQAWQAVISGEVQGTLYSLSAGLPFMKEGKARLLAINTAERLPQVPDVPTLKEHDLPSSLLWLALFAPPGTPDAMVEKLNATLAAALYRDREKSAKVFEQFVVADVAGGPPQAFERFLQTQQTQFDKWLADSHIKPQ